MELAGMLDISMELNEKTVVWREDAPPKLKPILRTPQDPVNFTWLDFGAHAGTHIDAPFFLFPEKWTTDQVPLSRLVGPCQVVDLTGVEGTITRADLEAKSLTRSILLFKTKNSFDPMVAYNPLHVDMDVEAAQYLVEKGIKTLGYDYLSFERDGKNAVHEVLLSKDIVVIDNLRLKDATAGNYTLVCLPIKVTGIDGAPSRAILLPELA